MASDEPPRGYGPLCTCGSGKLDVPMACHDCRDTCDECRSPRALACGTPPGSLCHIDDWRENATAILRANGDDVDAIIREAQHE